MRFTSRLARLEQSFVPLVQKTERIREAENRWLESTEEFLRCVPQSHLNPVVDKMESSQRSPFWELLRRAERGDWTPAPLTVGLIEVLLDGPDVGLYLECRMCRIPLPYRSGFWVQDAEPSKRYQGMRFHFETCPVCDGEISWRDGRELERWKYVCEGTPFIREGDYSFVGKSSLEIDD